VTAPVVVPAVAGRTDPGRTVALVTLGCARNEVDSEELAGRLEADGWTLVDEPADADAVLVNTCGFIESAKKDSIDTLLAAADLRDSGRPQAVVAVGCLAERYGAELAASLPEADAVLGFDDYASIGDRLRSVLAGTPLVPHVPSDRRLLLPISPADRPAAAGARSVPGHGGALADRADLSADLPAGVAPASGPRVLRRRLEGGPTAPLKLASGCDRRCTFCAIPSFRGSFVSRRPNEIIDEGRWLADQGVRELVLVSENSSSYGKDLGDGRLLETLLPELAGIDGIERVRVSYLQPAETRPSLVEVIARTPGVVPYFDLSFQHASAPVLRRMRRFGSTESFLELLEVARRLVPTAGARSNVIVGFPGETDPDVAELERFLTLARLDVVGVFGYSDEDGTEAATYEGKVDPAEVAERVERVGRLVEELTAQRAEERIGEIVEVLVESLEVDPDRRADGRAEHRAEHRAEGRAEHQGPEVDGATLLTPGDEPGAEPWRVGELVRAVVVATEGVDLVAQALPGERR
jgi:ribosomal protein S12 methylthiotransferase